MRFDNPIIKKIETKKEIIKDNCDYYSKLRKKLENGINSKECINSYLLEHPHNMDTYHWDKEARKGIRRLCEAWKFINENYPKDIISNLDSSGLIEIGRIIDPQNYSFRTDRVTLGFKNYTPPSPMRVDYWLDKFFEEVKSEYLHPIEKAAFTHLRIAGIQPFKDGNKRTARLIQNKILYESCLPPATIPLKERRIYLNHLESALAGYNDAYATENPSEMIKIGPFFYYISKKINENLDLIINEIKR